MTVMVKNKVKKKPMVKVESTRAQDQWVEEKRVIHFKQGIIGFPSILQYVMIENIKNTPFIWFQAVDNPSICFLIVDPIRFKQDYSIDIPLNELLDLEIEDKKDILVMVIVNTRGSVADMTANLKGPIIINSKKMWAKQIVLMDDTFSTQYPIFLK